MHTDLAASGVERRCGFAEAPADLDLAADQAGGNRVAVPPQRDQRVRCHGAYFDDLGGERNRWQSQQRLSFGKLTDRRAVTTTPISGGGAPRIERRLGLGRRGDAGGPPPRLGQVVDRLLHDTLAVPVTGRARVHAHAVVLRDRREAPLDLAGLWVDDRGHAVDPPTPRRAAEPAQDLVDTHDEMGLVIGVGEPASELARTRQGADEHERLGAPRGLDQLEPVPLDLLPGRVLDVHVGPPVRRRARLTVRPQLAVTDLAGEGLVAPLEPERDDLVEQHRGPHMRIVSQALAHVGLEPVEPVRLGLGPHPRLSFSVQVGPDRLAVPAGVSSDGRDRPAPLLQ